MKPVELEAARAIFYTPSSTCVAMETENACEKIVFDICSCTRIRLLWLLHIMLSLKTNDDAEYSEDVTPPPQPFVVLLEICSLLLFISLVVQFCRFEKEQRDGNFCKFIVDEVMSQ